MSIVSNNQSFNTAASGIVISGLVDKFKISMDTVMLGGRDITLHLPAAKYKCSASTCRFNSTYKRFMGSGGGLCQTCRGEGFLLEQRQTVYRANIRTTDRPYDSSDSLGQSTPAGRMNQEFVRTKMVVDAYDHIKQCVGATIDGVQYALVTDPRKTGFGGTLMYVVAFWKETDK